VGIGAHLQVHVRLRNTQFLEKDAGHPIVVVLPSVDQELVMTGLTQGLADRSGFDELGTRSHY
jgi:hypothetical protein